MTSKSYLSQMKEKRTEHEEQVYVTRYCRKNKILMFAIPNGGQRAKKTAADLKAEGVSSGVPDMFIPIPNQYYSGLFIELKRRPQTLKSGKKSISGLNISDNQKEWLRELNHNNYHAVVAYGEDEAIEIIQNYMDGVQWK